MSLNCFSESSRPSVLMESWICWPRDRLPADRPGGDLDVLLLDGADDVEGRQAQRGHLFRVEPDAHAVIALAERGHVADAGETEQLVLELDGGVIAQVEAVVEAVRREQVDRQQDVGDFS